MTNRAIAIPMPSPTVQPALDKPAGMWDDRNRGETSRHAQGYSGSQQGLLNPIGECNLSTGRRQVRLTDIERSYQCTKLDTLGE
jgi:hypothetical protein